ncbi:MULTISPECIES: phosphatidylglycerophosphatase A family protein [Acetobacter]|uniref:Phosphatidylglycerophosphatase A n=1 Tax=Acetobacter thailandicus TaxID=1502842 RepID=A0ABT3QFY8_9PROT|nr:MULTISPECIES: phosphatidylglycerophosphatase A [Acetobacter]MBS0979894.1 phosphatidylglycerophosphatase A [Acetobacter thailandicus]MBS0985189.1 phosphatidylglycerophosphatase A [Acetobacter thailandicus]MCX2564205.1 phosphatidylglycerophosphatase A [Acetobacter thailandicus]NHN95549.1 phosphatidylglycerophosphatase A [Acetobacter thailandicus]OUI88923.1 phosphatidylglycerophosphatase [Acetobacter sp. DmW_043]
MTIARIIATFGGCGLAPKAPGTVGSLAALIAGLPLLKKPKVLLLSAVAATGVGLWASHKAGDGEDHSWIVIDEVAGMWISLLACAAVDKKKSAGWLWPLVAFGLFRLFDIKKPGPVGYMDRRHDAVGIMGDDVVAGIMAALCIKVLRTAAGFFKKA